MNIGKLNLLACPTVLAFILLTPHSAYANEIATKTTETVSSVPAQSREIVFERPRSDESAIVNSQAQQSEAAIDSDCGCSTEPLTLDVSEEESKAAIERYGCDCAGCLNAVRQLQGKLPLL